MRILLKRHQSYNMMDRDENEQTSKYKKIFNAKKKKIFFFPWVLFTSIQTRFFSEFPLKFLSS